MGRKKTGYGSGKGACSLCGRVHPSRKKRARIQWESCSSVAIRRKLGRKE